MQTFRERIQAKLGAAEDGLLTKVAKASNLPPEFLENAAEMKQKAKEDKDEGKEKDEKGKEASLSTEYIQKIANQCYILAHNLEKMGAEEEIKDGPGKGANSVELIPPTTGEGIPVRGKAQASKSDEPKDEDSESIAQQPEKSVRTDETDPPGGGEEMKVDEVLKTASRVARVFKVLQKAAAEEVKDGPQVGENSVETSSEPKKPQQARKADTVQGAIDFKKIDGKEPVKKELEKLINEPAMSKKTDPVLQDMFDYTGKGTSKVRGDTVEGAGVKIAAQREYLSKIAERGCTCNDSGECGFCKLSQVLNKEDDDE